MSLNAWRGIGQRLLPGRRLKGRVSAIVNYGCYVEVEPGIEGLLRVGDDGMPDQLFHVGSEIDVVVVEIDAKLQRLSLGLVHNPPT